LLSHFFIDRPIFAAVVSIVITLTGAIALLYLPIAQYPQITPPAVSVSILYPGASAQVLADTVAAPIEQQVNGVEGMLYMASQMGNDGSYTLTVTFDVGADLNTALVMVQNRVALAMPLLPTEVQKQGITIRKKTPDILMIVSIYSPDGRYDDLYLSNYAMIHLRDELLRVDGVSDIIIFGERDYSIRAWLDPQKMASCAIDAGDVAAAIANQNLDAPAGQVGQLPAPAGQSFQLPIDTLGRLSDPEQFGDIIVKTSGTGSTTPATASAAPVAAPYGLPTAGPTNPTSGGAAITGAPGVSTALGNMLANTASGTSVFAQSMSSTLSTTSVTTAIAAPNTATSGIGANIGVTVGGGATASGGATAGGGATSGGGATLAGAITTGNATTGNATTVGLPGTIPGLSINSVATGATIENGTAAGAASIIRPQPTAIGIVRLRDVARVEMGAQNYNQAQTFDGHPSVGIAVFQLPGTNALDIAERVQSKMKQLQTRFPDGVAYQIAYDTTPFIRESVADVVQTLFEAVLLVGLVVLAFLQDWLTVLIPMTAVPVAIIGTFAAMAAVGFSLNNISLFGLVLAIGIVVDDAIVVVENVDRWLEQGLPPREATRKAMDEVTGPVIAVALVLCAVFVPCALISGITGRFFRQFAVTIAVSTVFSAINSLTLSPALAAILLKKKEESTTGSEGPKGQKSRFPFSFVLRIPARLLHGFSRRFNAAFGASTAGYAWAVGKLLRVHALVLLTYVALLGVTYEVFQLAPTGFVPEQDQGRILVSVQLPDAASLERTREALAQIDKVTRETPGVAHTLTVAGYSFVQQANGPNFGSMFITLNPFEERKSPTLSDTAIMAHLRRQWSQQVKDALVLAFPAPPIPGLSVAGGFKLMVEDRGGLGLSTLGQQTDNLIGKLQKEPALVGVSTQFRSNTPQLYVDIDRTKVASLGVSLNDVNQTLGIYLGSLYVNSFNAFGRHWQVTAQAEGPDRNRVEDINRLQVRNNQGEMVLLGTLVSIRQIGGPIFVNRYNLYTAASITGNLRPGISSGEVITAVDTLAGTALPLAMKTEWTELLFIQIRAGNTAMYVFALAVICVFLALAALYESWSLPLAVILVVPLCLLCSLTGVLLAHKAVDIFVQIGLVVLVGLACKNAILIVEFARYLHLQGRPRFEATLEASRLRLRPILMTSFAFILGVVPLVLAGGAGSEMRRSLGTAVFSGMIGVTLFGIFLTPIFFYVIQGCSETRLCKAAATRWIGTTLLGGLLGAATGFLLTQIHIGGLPWTPIVGGSLGVVLMMLLLAMRRRGKSKPKDEG
jgi:multidrug efflux pump